jgi:hypothetical protein
LLYEKVEFLSSSGISKSSLVCYKKDNMCFFEWGGDGVEQYVREHVCFLERAEKLLVYLYLLSREEKQGRRNKTEWSFWTAVIIYIREK